MSRSECEWASFSSDNYKKEKVFLEKLMQTSAGNSVPIPIETTSTTEEKSTEAEAGTTTGILNCNHNNSNGNLIDETKASKNESCTATKDIPLPIMTGVLHLRGQWKFGNRLIIVHGILIKLYIFTKMVCYRWKPSKAVLSENFIVIGSMALKLDEFCFGKATEVNSRPFAMKLSPKQNG